MEEPKVLSMVSSSHQAVVKMLEYAHQETNEGGNEGVEDLQTQRPIPWIVKVLWILPLEGRLQQFRRRARTFILRRRFWLRVEVNWCFRRLHGKMDMDISMHGQR